MKTTQLAVHVLAYTHFNDELAERLTGWHTDADGGEALAEMAGRSCFRSWTKPNPATATNAGYLTHILEVGHHSILEHGTATLWFTGVSRSLTHELVRHRHFSVSQESQRYVDAGTSNVVVPPLFEGDEEALDILADANRAIKAAYGHLADRAEKLLADRDLSKTDRRKHARQAARAVMPNMTETRIFVTGNYRAFRHFINLRASVHADVEIRAAAIAALVALGQVAPNVFADYTISTLPDGTEVASSPYAERA